MNKRIHASVFSSIMSICMFSNYISYSISTSTENIVDYNNRSLENELFSDGETIGLLPFLYHFEVTVHGEAWIII